MEPSGLLPASRRVALRGNHIDLPIDPRRLDSTNTGPVALAVAKIIRISEWLGQSDRQSVRLRGKDALGAFMRLSEPVQFDAPDGRPVNLLFVLLVPEQATEHHLQLLSELAQMFSDRAFRHQLATAPDAAAVHELFAQWGGDAADHGRPAV